jgi:hypothetical protein
MSLFIHNDTLLHSKSKICPLLTYYAVYTDVSGQQFGQNFKRKEFQESVSNYHHSLRNNPEVRSTYSAGSLRPLSYRGVPGSLPVYSMWDLR